MFVAQFLDEENAYEYSLEIRNLKEEAKDENYESGISDNDEDSKEWMVTISNDNKRDPDFTYIRGIFFLIFATL